MNVVCIKNKGITDWLTIGKTYNVINEDDNGYKFWYPKKLLSEIMNEKIKKYESRM